MNRVIKTVIAFIISYIAAFFIVGYVKSTVFARIHWRAEATAWDKFREYYIRTFNYNLLPALIVAIIFTMIFIVTVCLVNRKKA